MSHQLTPLLKKTFAFHFANYVFSLKVSQLPFSFFLSLSHPSYVFLFLSLPLLLYIFLPSYIFLLSLFLVFTSSLFLSLSLSFFLSFYFFLPKKFSFSSFRTLSLTHSSSRHPYLSIFTIFLLPFPYSLLLSISLYKIFCSHYIIITLSHVSISSVPSLPYYNQLVRIIPLNFHSQRMAKWFG